MKAIINGTRLGVAITALGLVGFLPIGVEAEAPPDFMNSVLLTRNQALKVPRGETVAMVCIKCRTVLVSQVDKKKSFLGWFNPKTKHECPGCGGEFSLKEVSSGQGGRLSMAEYVHTCSKCGDDSAFCCATKPGSGTTKGMENQNK